MPDKNMGDSLRANYTPPPVAILNSFLSNKVFYTILCMIYTMQRYKYRISLKPGNLLFLQKIIRILLRMIEMTLIPARCS